MRTISPALQGHLDGGATTLCWCWRITRADAVRLGFTDHDRTLAFEGTDFEAASGLSATEAREEIGLGVDNLEVEGALRSDRLAAADLEAGLYDDARIEVFRVNWQDVGQRLLLRVGSIGKVARGARSFRAEVRGLAHYLQQEQGRIYQYGCDAEIGDGRCGIDLSLPAYRGTGTIVAVESAHRFTASGLTSFAGDFFTRGRLVWTGGPNAAAIAEVKHHRNTSSLATVEIWQRTVAPLAVGHAFTITAGCDKQLPTCAAKFSNVVNYRGFPHMPGNDFLTSYPNKGDRNDGGGMGST